MHVVRPVDILGEPVNSPPAMKFKDSPVVDLPVGVAVLSFEQDNGSFQVGTSVWPCSSSSPSSPNAGYPLLLPPSPSTQILTPTFSRLPESVPLNLAPVAAPLAFPSQFSDSTSFSPTSPPSSPPSAATSSATAMPFPRLQSMLSCTGTTQSRSAPSTALRPRCRRRCRLYGGLRRTAGLRMDALVASHGAVLLGYQLRSPEAHRVFWDRCLETFPVIEKVPQEDLHPDYAYEESAVYILRKINSDSIITLQNKVATIMSCMSIICS
ncbi:hypothetical protein KSP40_PGU002853 [Platanthera guangdongensis]|uniref:Uncharacterized protein n=1 Tax=Platanthera guangdongensis TaxID=2320717 RepID=A0ABR2LK59_9ASPA